VDDQIENQGEAGHPDQELRPDRSTEHTYS
jgi:hypothetical protein